MTTTRDPLVVTQRIEAPADVVYAHFTDPARYVAWMGTDVILEPEPGGGYFCGVRDGLAASGEFVELDPPRRVVFTWGWEGHPLVPPGSSRVEVELTEEDGVTTVTLTHHDLPSDDQRAQHGQGWTLYLDRLAVAATGGDPGPDPNATPPPGT